MFDLLPSEETLDRVESEVGGRRTADRAAASTHGSVHAIWKHVVSTALAPGDLVVVLANGLISERWAQQLQRLGLRVELLQAAFGEDVPAQELARRLGRDLSDEVRAVFVREVEPSTGVASDLAAVRRAMDESFHEALFVLDATGPGSTVAFEMELHGADLVATERDGVLVVLGLERALRSGKPVCDATRDGRSGGNVGRETLHANHDRVVAALRAGLAAMEFGFVLRHPRLAARGATVVRLSETLDGPAIARTATGRDDVRLESLHDPVCGQIMCLFHPIGMTPTGCVAVIERLEAALIKAGAGIWPGAGVGAVKGHLGMMCAVDHIGLSLAAE